MISRFQRILRDASGGEGGGEDNTPPVPPVPDPTKGYEAALAKHNNDASAMARQVYADQERLRAELAETRAKVPKPDAVVLAKEDGELFAKYKALGDLDGLSAKLAERDSFDGQLKAVAREKLFVEAAKAHDFDPEVLQQMPGADKLEIKIADVSKAGKTVKVAHVVTRDESGEETTTPLDEFAKAKWPKLLPALKVARPDLSTPGRRQPAANGTLAIRQDDGQPRKRLASL